MGKQDITQMKFFRDTKRFADLWNGLAFNGRQVVKWDELEEISPVGLAVNLDTVQNGDEIFHNRDVKDVVNLYQKRNDKIAFKEYIDTQKMFDRESIEVVTEMVTSKELKEYMQTNKDSEEGGNLNMCKAITDLIQDSVIKAYANLVIDGDLTIEKAAAKLQITEEEFCKQAESLGFKLVSV